MCGFIEQQLRGCGEKHRQSWALSLVWSVLLCVHDWNTSTPTVGGFRASLAWFWWHMFLFLGSAEWSQSVYPAWRMAVCFLRESVLSVCLSVCLWLGGRASQETAHKHTDTHRVFVSCLNKGGRWGFVAAGGSVVLIRPSVSSPCRIPVSVIESRSETTTSNRPHNNTLIEISPETILRVVSRRNRIAVCVCSGKHFHSGSPLEELSVTHTFKLDPRLSHRPSGSFSFPSLTSVLQCPLLQTWPQDPKKASLSLSLVSHGMRFSTKHTKSENLLN